jgi:hypothetical protein
MLEVAAALVVGLALANLPATTTQFDTFRVISIFWSGFSISWLAAKRIYKINLKILILITDLNRDI